MSLKKIAVAVMFVVAATSILGVGATIATGTFAESTALSVGSGGPIGDIVNTENCEDQDKKLCASSGLGGGFQVEHLCDDKDEPLCQ